MKLREMDISDKQQVLGFFVSEPNPDKNGRMKREETFARLFPAKHEIIKKLTKLGKIVPIETLGVDVYEYTKQTE